MSAENKGLSDEALRRLSQVYDKYCGRPPKGNKRRPPLISASKQGGNGGKDVIEIDWGAKSEDIDLPEG